MVGGPFALGATAAAGLQDEDEGLEPLDLHEHNAVH
jgi:hypothetical protein